jgi:hypothetical protein
MAPALSYSPTIAVHFLPAGQARITIMGNTATHSGTEQRRLARCIVVCTRRSGAAQKRKRVQGLRPCPLEAFFLLYLHKPKPSRTRARLRRA